MHAILQVIGGYIALLKHTRKKPGTWRARRYTVRIIPLGVTRSKTLETNPGLLKNGDIVCVSEKWTCCWRALFHRSVILRAILNAQLSSRYVQRFQGTVSTWVHLSCSKQLRFGGYRTTVNLTRETLCGRCALQKQELRYFLLFPQDLHVLKRCAGGLRSMALQPRPAVSPCHVVIDRLACVQRQRQAQKTICIPQQTISLRIFQVMRLERHGQRCRQLGPHPSSVSLDLIIRARHAVSGRNFKRKVGDIALISRRAIASFSHISVLTVS